MRASGKGWPGFPFIDDRYESEPKSPFGRQKSGASPLLPEPRADLWFSLVGTPEAPVVCQACGQEIRPN